MMLRQKYKRARSVVAGAVVVLLVVWTSGLVRPLHVTAGSMAPAIRPGDHVVMDAVAFFARAPQRGDIVVFRAVSMPPFEDGVMYPKRVVGLPGDRLRLAAGKLHVNGAPLALTNWTGEIRYVPLPGSKYLASGNDTLTVPAGHYFVLGDNSANSLDSRSAGFLPRKRIMGRIWFCYWPPGRAGSVR
jgi:signal peptidase I